MDRPTLSTPGVHPQSLHFDIIRRHQSSSQLIISRQPRDFDHAPTRFREAHHGESQADPPKINPSRTSLVVYLSDTPRPKQPPKRKSGGAAESGAPGRAGARQSKLAKEHDITAQEEAEIKEAFSLFAEPMDGEKEGVIPIDDVRRAMMYVCWSLLVCPASSRSRAPSATTTPERGRPLGQWKRLLY